MKKQNNNLLLEYAQTNWRFDLQLDNGKKKVEKITSFSKFLRQNCNTGFYKSLPMSGIFNSKKYTTCQKLYPPGNQMFFLRPCLFVFFKNILPVIVYIDDVSQSAERTPKFAADNRARN